MIRAHMATYPLRQPLLEAAVERIAEQVEHLCVVLNEYHAIPEVLAKFSNVEPIIPDEDLKDVGKFLPVAAPDDRVFLVDDDIVYPENYVRRSIRLAKKYGEDGRVFGYHGSRFPTANVTTARERRVFGMNAKMQRHMQMDQLGTGTVLLRGKQLPNIDQMMGSKKFVDVRFARLMFAQGISLWALPRPSRVFPSRMDDLPAENRDTIARSFTRRWPSHVLEEVNTYAGHADACEAQRNSIEGGSDVPLHGTEASRHAQRSASSDL